MEGQSTQLCVSCLIPENFLAKSHPKQSLAQHTNALLRLLCQFRDCFPDFVDEKMWELLQYTCLYHDYGKLQEGFQNLLQGHKNSNFVHHGWLSPLFVEPIQSLSKQEIQLIRTAILFHHDRGEGFTDIEKIASALSQLQPLARTLNLTLSQRAIRMYKFFASTVPQSDEHKKTLLSKEYIILKGMLNRLDHGASAGIPYLEMPISNANVQNVREQTFNMLQEKKYTLTPVQAFMQAHSDQNVVVVAPTGSGKTEAALLWGGASKLFYTLPLKVAINCIFHRIQSDIGYSSAQLLHSDSFYALLDKKEEQSSLEQMLLSKELTAPLLVTTADQILKTAFLYNGYEKLLVAQRKAHVVVDEIQMYAPQTIATMLCSLKQVIQLDGKIAIMTATFPHFLLDIMQNKLNMQITFQSFVGQYAYRHRLKWVPSDFDTDRILKSAKDKRVLIIVNTIKKAQAIYAQLNVQENTHIFHARFIKKDRALLEEQILAFAPNDNKRQKKCGIWITTQIVEASLDVDFDEIHTSMCSMDSLLQRMGRCYRSRNIDHAQPNIFVYDNDDTGGNHVIPKELYTWTKQAVQQYDDQLLIETQEVNLKENMMSAVFHPEKNTQLLSSKYYNDIISQIDSLQNLSIYSFGKKEAENLFRDIPFTCTVIPNCIFQNLAHQKDVWYDAIQNAKGLLEKEIIRKEILEYTLSVDYKMFKKHISSHEFIPQTGVYIIDLEYIFDENSLQGEGLVSERKEDDNFF